MDEAAASAASSRESLIGSVRSTWLVKVSAEA